MDANTLDSICSAIRTGIPPRDAMTMYDVDVNDLDDTEGARQLIEKSDIYFKARMIEVLARCALEGNGNTTQFNSAKWLLENRYGYKSGSSESWEFGDIKPQVINVVPAEMGHMHEPD